ncbi:hypothetical protein MUCCIDRAFT_166364 [Mucor lusitanicus CBS 277.49]|uniref:Uncharacterized protein n=1 Tax=Mucor lusitanicus CBS 277.49 TaxID=747725 RepID=A0A168J0G3_MUCCL|nr:hypothetical protein MUCCIDRAFT_166364 [Mucor lusitanicus CBS 277.49]
MIHNGYLAIALFRIEYPFGISLIKSKKSKHNPPPAPPVAEEPPVQIYYTLPCYQFQMPQQMIFYNVNTCGGFCNYANPVAPPCYCQHKKPDDGKKPDGKKPDDKKKPKKPADKKKKKKEEKKEESKKIVVVTFWNPRTPRKGVFER